MKINVADYVVRGSDGSISHEETIAKFAKDLANYTAQRELEADTIGVVVHGLFNQYLGRRLSTDYVVSEALKSLQATPDNFKTLTMRIKEYIKSSPDFDTLKGPGNGVGRICDLPAK